MSEFDRCIDVFADVFGPCPIAAPRLLLFPVERTFLMCRYGDLFRTHLFGYPSIVVTDPEAAKFVLDQSALFKQLALPEVGRLLGSKFLGYSNHRVHSRLRRVMQSPLLALHNSIPYIEVLALGLMYSWEGRTINTLQQLHHVRIITSVHFFYHSKNRRYENQISYSGWVVMQYTFDVATHFIIGAQPKPEVESLRRACNNLFGGVRAWPISLIGTNFWWATRVSIPGNERPFSATLCFTVMYGHVFGSAGWMKKKLSVQKTAFV